jgi:hypothetical protein
MSSKSFWNDSTWRGLAIAFTVSRQSENVCTTLYKHKSMYSALSAFLCTNTQNKGYIGNDVSKTASQRCVLLWAKDAQERREGGLETHGAETWMQKPSRWTRSGDSYRDFTVHTQYKSLDVAQRLRGALACRWLQIKPQPRQWVNFSFWLAVDCERLHECPLWLTVCFVLGLHTLLSAPRTTQ